MEIIASALVLGIVTDPTASPKLRTTIVEAVKACCQSAASPTSPYNDREVSPLDGARKIEVGLISIRRF